MQRCHAPGTLYHTTPILAPSWSSTGRSTTASCCSGNPICCCSNCSYFCWNLVGCGLILLRSSIWMMTWLGCCSLLSLLLDPPGLSRRCFAFTFYFFVVYWKRQHQLVVSRYQTSFAPSLAVEIIGPLARKLQHYFNNFLKLFKIMAD